MKTLKVLDDKDEDLIRTVYFNLLYLKKDIMKTHERVSISTLSGTLDMLRWLLERLDIKYVEKEII